MKLKVLKLCILGLIIILVSVFAKGQSFILNNSSSDGNVFYNASEVNTSKFIIFGDGTFSTNESGSHQYQYSQNGYTAEAYFNLAYDQDPPFLISKNTGSTASGNNVVPHVQGVNPVKIATSWNPSQDIENYFMLIFENPVNSTLNGIVEFYFDSSQLTLNDAGILVYNSQITNHQISTFYGSNLYDSIISWNFSNLDPGEQRIIYIPLTSNVVTGTNINVGAMFGDGESSKTIDNRFLSSGFPHDPNSKSVYPSSLAPNISDAQTLTYTIRFQNEGTGPAVNVLLEDILDEQYLDVSTLNFKDSEYSYNYSFDPYTSKLSILFPNINLPGLNQSGPYAYSYDETESFITFEICTRPVTFVDECIENYVDIYFDNQPAIKTNTAIICANIDDPNPIVYFQCGDDVIIFKEQNETDIGIYPNPFQDKITLSGVAKENSEIVIFNNVGQRIKSVIASGISENVINLSDIPNGIYFISYHNNFEYKTKRIVKY